MNLKTKQALGPSLLHVLMALAVTGLGALASAILASNGSLGAFYGATIAAVWFIRGEIDQLNPHWGWKTWTLFTRPQDKQRLVRQAGWPSLAAFVFATLIALLSR
jgi:hypothetical protein